MKVGFEVDNKNFWSMTELETRNMHETSNDELLRLKRMLQKETFYAKGNEKTRLITIELKVLDEILKRGLI